MLEAVSIQRRGKNKFTFVWGACLKRKEKYLWLCGIHSFRCFPNNKNLTEDDQATERKTYRGRARDDERGGGSRDDPNVPVALGRREEEGPRCRSSVLFPLRSSGDLAGSSSWVSADRRPVVGRSRCCSLCSRAKERPACEAIRFSEATVLTQQQLQLQRRRRRRRHNQHNRTEHSTTQHSTSGCRASAP